MHRQGLAPEELPQALGFISKGGLSVQGSCSHLSDADGTDPTFTRQQIACWNELVREWKRASPETEFYHLSATKGVRYADEIDANVMRLGIGLYGFDPNEEIVSLKQTLKACTHITALREVKPGESVGYNCTFVARRPTVIATIPMGYFEGVDRRLSNKGFVRIHGRECPIVGRVSMNMTTVDVAEAPDAAVGDEVEVIGTGSSAKNSISSVAMMCDTIPYEILIHIPAHLRRVVV
jgi:alanine racemase